MRKLNLPERETERTDLTTSIYTYRSKGKQAGHSLSPAETDAIIAIYDAYDANGGQPSNALKGPNLAISLVETVKKAYAKTYADQPLYHIRNSLLLGVDTCPICGMDAADELDHFLPKSDFKILSIYVRNLIPICTKCNKDKRTIAGDNPAAQFAHAYLDDIPETQFLTATITLNNAKLDVQIGVSPTAAISEELSQRLTFQLQELELDVRYKREINIYLSAFTLHWHPLYEAKGAGGMIESLVRQSAYEASKYHSNDWRALVFLGLSSNVEFCDGGFREAFPVPEHLQIDI